jgi:hypothetical protein
MGTRNLTMVISNGETKVAQYGQWDGYPSGNGVIVLDFLHSTNLDEFKKKLNKVIFVNGNKEKEIQNWLKSIGCENGWMNGDQSKLYQEKYPYLTRDNGARILEMIRDGEEDEIWITDSTDFAGDSLFCEWAYLIDLDNNKLEVYEGFNKEPLTIEDRFFYLMQEAQSENKDRAEHGIDSEYYPIKMIKSYDLNYLPLEDEFLNDLTKQQEQEN